MSMIDFGFFSSQLSKCFCHQLLLTYLFDGPPFPTATLYKDHFILMGFIQSVLSLALTCTFSKFYKVPLSGVSMVITSEYF